MRHFQGFSAKRHQRIVRMLEASGGLRTSQLARALGVSVATVRRDLEVLARRGLVERAHGGALPARMGTGREPPYALKAERMVPEKERIAARAADLVPEGSTVIVDSGTTALAAARRLVGRRLTVVCLDLPAALAVSEQEGPDVWIPGGRVRSGLFSLVGPWAERELAQIHADIFLLGADAVDVDGVTNSTVEEAEIKRLAMKAARQTVLLADHTKFGRKAMAMVCRLEELAAVVTDAGVGDFRRELAERVAQVYVV